MGEGGQGEAAANLEAIDRLSEDPVAIFTFYLGFRGFLLRHDDPGFGMDEFRDRTAH